MFSQELTLLWMAQSCIQVGSSKKVAKIKKVKKVKKAKKAKLAKNSKKK